MLQRKGPRGVKRRRVKRRSKLGMAMGKGECCGEGSGAGVVCRVEGSVLLLAITRAVMAGVSLAVWVC